MARWHKQLRAATFTDDGEAPMISGGQLGLLQYRRKKARVRRGSIGAQSHAGMGRTEEGETGSDDGPGNSGERRRCGRWRGPKAEREGEVCSVWMRGHRGEKEGRAALHPFFIGAAAMRRGGKRNR
jgi:hypothetical protein